MTQNLKSWLKSIRNGVHTFLIPILIATFIKVFFIDIYRITSISMEPALFPGDLILVSKMSYGARLLKPAPFFKQKKIEYFRTKGWNRIKKGDEFVFNYPDYYSYSDSFPNIYGTCLVKRCFALPGDCVLIKNEKIGNEKISNEESGGFQHGSNLFPYDSSFNWSLGNYGPLYVPAKGQSMELTKKNVYWYKDILRYENPKARIKDSSLIINAESIFQYTFRHNYYFMLGDNFYNSQDSRYWGLVPEENVIGKAVIVLFSIDQNESGLNKIRWKRFFKVVK